MSKDLPTFLDFSQLSEDQRINMIGHMSIVHHQTNAFAVESHEIADRYIKKLQEKFPNITILGKLVSPKGIVFVKVGPPTE